MTGHSRSNIDKKRLAVISLIVASLSCFTTFTVFKSGILNGQTTNQASMGQFSNTNSELKKDREFSLLFFGDIMLDRGVRVQISKLGYDEVFVKSTKELSDKYDITIANLEGPITNYPSKLVTASGKSIEGYTFTFATSSAQALRDSGIDIVSLANNHSDNFGQEGLRQTAKYLSSANVNFFGNPTNSGEDAQPITPISKTLCIDQSKKERKEICIAFIGYHEFTYKNESQIIEEINKAKLAKVDFIVIMPHWGIEYQKTPSQKQKNLAHSWIDAGADLVVGSHPHIIQTIETYKNRKIYYSLGNYLFDQYFSYDTTHGLAVGFHFQESESNFSLKSTDLIPLDITNIRVRTANATDTAKILGNLQEI